MQGPAWSLVSYYEDEPGKPRTGVLVDGTVHRLPEHLAERSLLELLAAWDSLSPTLQRLCPERGTSVPDATLLAPLRFPAKVLCAGANYYGHLEEMGIEPPVALRPYFFFKPPTTTIIGPGQAMVLPTRSGRQIDWEAELAVVIGRRCRYVPAARAREVVAGWIVANDISARDRLNRDDPIAPPFGFDWFGAKAEDTSFPMGPGMVPEWLVEDPQGLAVRLSVNGLVKQDSTTADMICGICELIAAASDVVTLEPGDVISTGTPAGVGLPRDEFLAPGDEVTVAIEQVGSLHHTVVNAAEPAD